MLNFRERILIYDREGDRGEYSKTTRVWVIRYSFAPLIQYVWRMSQRWITGIKERMTARVFVSII